MASQHGLPPNQRYLMNIADGMEKREKGAEDDRKSRQDGIDRLAQRALPVPTGQTFQRPQRASRSGRRTISELDLGVVTPEASRPAPLPTPPISPVHSRAPTDTASAAPLASPTKSQEIAHLQTSLEDLQSQIHALTLKLEVTQNEVQRLRDERREASKEYLCVVCEDKEEKIEKCPW